MKMCSPCVRMHYFPPFSVYNLSYLHVKSFHEFLEIFGIFSILLFVWSNWWVKLTLLKTMLPTRMSIVSLSPKYNATYNHNCNHFETVISCHKSQADFIEDDATYPGWASFHYNWNIMQPTTIIAIILKWLPDVWWIGWLSKLIKMRSVENFWNCGQHASSLSIMTS